MDQTAANIATNDGNLSLQSPFLDENKEIKKEPMEDDVFEEPWGYFDATESVQYEPELNLDWSGSELEDELETEEPGISDFDPGSVKCEPGTDNSDEKVQGSVNHHSKQAEDQRHFLRTSEKKSYIRSCSECREEFRNINSLIVHEKSHSLKYKCTVCDEKLRTVRAWRLHVKEHYVKNNNTCSVCKLQFTAKDILLNHIGTHLDPMYDCSQCDKKFRSYSNLSNHVRACHLASKKYPCSQCRKQFKTKHEVKQHEVTHKQEGKYGCSNPNCNKKFVTERLLKQHQLRHSEERPHKCGRCEKAFKAKTDLKKHEKYVHSVCGRCSQEFGSRKLLSQHLDHHVEGNIIQN